MKNMTVNEKMIQSDKIKDYMETHGDFVSDMVTLGSLLKYSINFDKNGNLASGDYDAGPIEEVAEMMAGIDFTLYEANAYKKGRSMHDVTIFDRPMFCNLELVKKYKDERMGVVLVIDDSLKYDHEVKIIDTGEGKSIIFVLIGKHYMNEYLLLIVKDKEKMIMLMADIIKKYAAVLYPEVPRELSIPIAITAAFIAIASFHESLFENTLFKDEEFGWFYENVLNSDVYKDLTISNLKKINGLSENDDIKNISLKDLIVDSGMLSEEIYNDLMSYIDNIIDPISEFFKNKTIVDGEYKRAVKRFDYMLPKKSKYIKDVDIEEWLNTPLYLFECSYDDDNFVIAISDCISQPVLRTDFSKGILIAVPGNLNCCDKKFVKIAYYVSKMISEYVYDDEDSIIKRTISCILGIALTSKIDINPKLFELLPDDKFGIKEIITEYIDSENWTL